MTRDRDPAGRPRNARPRDGLGRPLDRAADPGSAADRIPDDLVPAGRGAGERAARVPRAGRPFHAHEVLEAAWKYGPATERDLWQGLAQIAVGLTHARRGNAGGAVTPLGRGVQRVRGYQDGDGSPDGGGSREGDDSPDRGGSGRAARREASPFGMNI